jgi:predicted small lipoprotein YifL
MRTKSIVIAALALLTLAAGCKRKGGGYLAPAPVPASAAR